MLPWEKLVLGYQGAHYSQVCHYRLKLYMFWSNDLCIVICSIELVEKVSCPYNVRVLICCRF